MERLHPVHRALRVRRLENRPFTFAAIVPVAGIAEDELGATYTGFTVAYLLARAVNQRVDPCRFARGAVPAGGGPVPDWLCPGDRDHPGFTTGAARVVLFALSVLLEIATPTFTIAQQTALPKLSTSKIPERFGQFTIIVLGESVVGVMLPRRRPWSQSRWNRHGRKHGQVRCKITR